MLKVALWLSPLLFAACAGSFTYIPPEYSAARWNVGTVEVSIHDDRPNVKATPPTVPPITMGGGEGADVKLPATFQKFVRYRLGQVVSGAGPTVKLDITVKKAHAEWSANAISESEKAEVTLVFKVFDADGHLSSQWFGTGKREFSSGDASDEELAAVFRAACNDAFDQFLGNEEVISQLNAAR